MPHVEYASGWGGLFSLLVGEGAFFCRWDEDFDGPSEGEWWHVIKDQPEDIAKLPKKTRWQIRQGWKNVEVVPLGRDAIAAEGYDVYRSAFDRYITFEEILSVDAFNKAIAKLPDETEFWGVRERGTGRLVAFSENLVRDGACFYDTIWFEPSALKAYAGYMLIHEMNKHYLNERGLRYVSDGARSISHQTKVHEFLEQKFGFRRAYARLRVVYFPGFGLVVRLLYPFRRWFNGRSSGIAQKVAVVLEQERIRRACMESGQQE